MVALQLFHGRKDLAEGMDDWGTPGPIFLVDYVHTTYKADIKLGIPEPAGDGDLHIVEDCVYYDGVFYGDWSVCSVSVVNESYELRMRLAEFNPSKAIPPVKESSNDASRSPGWMDCDAG